MVNRCFSRRTAASAVAVAALVLWVAGCGPAQQQVPLKAPEEVGAEPPLDECERASEVQLLLADLVPSAAIGFGSLSPFLYEVAPDGVVSIVASATVRDADAAQLARDLLEQVNRKDRARKIFGNNVTRSQRECTAASCPRDARYELAEVQRLLRPGGSELGVRYRLDRAPGDAEQSAFVLLMQHDNPPCPPVTQAHFEGQSLVVRAERRCTAPDCHRVAQSCHSGSACCTRNVPRGTWQRDNSDPSRPRHCCQSR